MFLYVVFRKKINKEFVWHKHFHFYPSTVYSIIVLLYIYVLVRQRGLHFNINLYSLYAVQGKRDNT